MKYIWVLSLLFSQMSWSVEDNLKGDAVQFSDLRVGPDQLSDLYVEKPQLDGPYVEIPQFIPYYYLHYCHSRGSALTEVITSLMGDPFQACKSVGLEPGEGFAKIDLKPFLQYIPPQRPQTTNLIQNGQPINEYINPTMESSRPKIGGKAFLDIVCKDHENPKKCASELINGKTSPWPTVGTKAFLDIVCKDHENPEKCEIEFTGLYLKVYSSCLKIVVFMFF